MIEDIDADEAILAGKALGGLIIGWLFIRSAVKSGVKGALKAAAKSSISVKLIG